MRLLVLIPLLLVFVAPAQIEKNNQSPLTIEKIMQDPDKWIGTSPEGISWSIKSDEIYFTWNPNHDTLPSLFSYSVKDKKIDPVAPEKERQLPGRDASFNSDKSKKVFTRNGNLVLYDFKKGMETQLTDWLMRASSPVFVLNDTRISFMMSQNLFLLDPQSGKISQVTNFSSGADRPERGKKEEPSWLEEQQTALFDVLKSREALDKTRQAKQKESEPKLPLQISLGKKRLLGASLSPTGKYVVYSAYLPPEGAKSTEVTHFVTRSGYTETMEARSKVGSPESAAETAIFDIEANKIIRLKTDILTKQKYIPAFLSDYPDKMPKDSSEIKDREIGFYGGIWNDKTDQAIVTALSLDNKDRWMLLLDAATGNLEILDHQHDEAWIGGPGISGSSLSTRSIGWLPDGKSVWFHSEVSGYSHLYAVDTQTKTKKALTSGKFEVSNAFISNDKKFFYLTANKIHPGVTHFYKMPVEGGEMTQITSVEGGNDVTLSPDEKYLAILHSTANKPWELYLQENKPGAVAEKLTRSLTPEFEKYNWRMPEFISFTASDGAEVYARIYRPEKPVAQGPAVIFVHGAGYLQNAHKWWSDYFREYMFNNFLVDNGYTVLDIDYRGSAGYGRDCRTGIYRHMGGKDLSDHVDGAKLLVEKYNVSPKKIGLYGGSYGGFMTLMALFTAPDIFASGAALRSVTDWAHYNHGYTSNILNTPEEDSLAYVRSSPIYFADGLKGRLLMCHGMVDDNVEFQDIVRLTQRLIELGKENWELAVFPVESHGFTEPSSWTDEYKRIYKLFEETLKE